MIDPPTEAGRAPVRLPAFEAGTFRLGLSPIAEEEWLEFGDDFDDQMAEKRALFSERRDAVLRVLPSSEPASLETLDTIREVLAKHHSDRNRAVGRAFHPLEAAARLVQEDLCVLERAGDDYRLSAGCVCFPSNWSLAEKLGRSARAIHDPVPGFDPALAAPVDRIFTRLAEGRLVMRFNWLVHDTPALHQVDRMPDTDPIEADEVGQRVWLRVERQTLRRLPRSGAVLFTIRTHVHSIAQAIATPDAAHSLARALRGMAPPLWAYRRMDRIGPPLLTWLDARAAAPNARN